MTKNQFKIQLRGTLADNEHIRLSDFIEELSSVKETLFELDKRISNTRNPTTDYKIIDLSHSSPSAVVIEAIPLDTKIDKSTDVIETFFYGLDKIQKGVPPDNFDSTILEKYKKIAGGFRRKINDLTFYYENTSVQIDKSLEQQIVEIIGEDEIFDGYIEGALEMINFHKGANQFKIYPSLGSEKVVCHFPKDLLTDAIKAVGEYIKVVGKLKYKKRDRFPYGIEVLNIIVHLKEEEIPSFISLRGIAQNTLGGLSSEAFVRKIRNAQ